jgi:hypothetical protein
MYCTVLYVKKTVDDVLYFQKPFMTFSSPCQIPAYIFNHIYEELNRENETVRDRFFRVLWITTLIWKLSDYPLPDHVAQLEKFLAEAKLTNPDGTPKTPKKRKASTATDKIKMSEKAKKTKKK